MAFFSSIRLSKHFTLLDFVNGHTLYSSGRPFTVEEVSPLQIRTGQRLCEELLEPLMELLGPLSISNGLIPKDLLSGRWTPHTWQPQDGAAADIVVHDWVNQGNAPIHLIDVIMEAGLPFERFISYAGSEVVCLSGGRTPANRGAVYENIRIPGATRPKFHTWSRGGPAEPFNIPPRPDWRRTEGETTHHTQGRLRAQHLRVSEYFLASDFGRNETAIEAGKPWMPAFRKPEVIEAARCVGEVLDVMTRQVGRISVTRGVTRPGEGIHEGHTWDGPTFSVEVQIPLGASPTEAIGKLPVQHVTDAKWREAPGGSLRCVLTVKRFKPAKLWSSAA